MRTEETCGDCGKVLIDLPDEAKYCHFCGSSLPKEEIEELSPWEEADQIMTAAAVCLVKFRSLNSMILSGRISKDAPLGKATAKLYEIGKVKYEVALKMVSELSETESKQFWDAQVRNKDAKRFEDLITKKSFNDSLNK